MTPRPLPPRFYARPSELVARGLLGQLLVTTVDDRRASGRIVETEAYTGPNDPASHAAERIGRTRRNASMYGSPGIAYVYRSYGAHWCLNAVTDEADHPAAVLIRAIEPIDGLDVMRARRAAGARMKAVRTRVPDRLLGSGPGRLTQALGIDGGLDGHRLDRTPLLILEGESPADAEVVVGPRIGISRAADWPLRFHVRGSRFVSR